MLNEWLKWCRLCAKENGADINVLVKDENMSNLSETIQKIFAIEITSTDGISTSICFDCHKFISEVVCFWERSSKVQSMYSKLKFSSDVGTLWIDLNALRNQFGITTKSNVKFISKSTETADLTNNFNNKENISKTREENDNLLENFNTGKMNITNFSIGGGKNDEDMTEIDYLDEDLLEIKHEYQDNDDENDINGIEDDDVTKRVTRSKKANVKIDNNSKFKCEICGKTFVRKRYYRHHIKTKHNIFSCDICYKEFKTKISLTSHLDTHSPTKLICPFCDKSFGKKVDLHSHVRIVHDNVKPYICEECGKAFGTCGALKEHKYTHVDDTPYQCSKCPKKFKNKSRLKIHTDTHNDTMYVCTTCGLQLNTRRTLLMHMVVHSDQKKHKCNFCGNEYKRAKALKNHLILHTGLRPYSCPFCNKTFANGSNCRSHKKKAHPKELAALEATGEKQSTTNIPKLEQLKSVSLGDIAQIARQEIWNNDVIQTDFNEQQICIPQIITSNYT